MKTYRPSRFRFISISILIAFTITAFGLLLLSATNVQAQSILDEFISNPHNSVRAVRRQPNRNILVGNFTQLPSIVNSYSTFQYSENVDFVTARNNVNLAFTQQIPVLGQKNILISNITVDRVDDTNASACTNAPNDCTLRGALSIAVSGDTILFSTTVFPTNTTTTILITSALPALSQGAIIIQGNIRNDEGPAVVIDGTGAGAGVNGLTITSNINVISRLRIKGFSGDGVLIDGGANNTVGVNNQCGYSEVVQNGGYGVRITGETADGNRVGDAMIGFTVVNFSTATIGANSLGGVRIEGGADNAVEFRQFHVRRRDAG